MRNIFYYIICLFLLAVSTCFGQSGQISSTELLQQREKTINTLIAKMTLEEKVMQLMYNAPAIPRLQVPQYNWWNEALHGVGRSAPSTIFPQAIGLAATFDTNLVHKVADAISTEARALFNSSIAKDKRQQYSGITFWTPNINIFRDPRWGRGQETYGEDPFLTGSMGVAFVKGLQGDHPYFLKTAACAKHFAVHSGPEKTRHEFNAVVSLRDLRETYLPAFKSLVQNNVEAVMCAYNAVNGMPCCGNNFLLQEILKKEWGFKGHIVSDCWALVDFYKGHSVVKNSKEAAVLALRAGVNLNCGSTFPSLIDAVKEGMVSEKEVDAALFKLLETKHKLGMLFNQKSHPYASLSHAQVNYTEHSVLSRRAAQASIVMLKNTVLPLRNDLSRYFVTGPLAANIEMLIGNYHGVSKKFITVLEGITNAVAATSQVQYRTGVLLEKPNVNPIDWASNEAKEADAVICVLGINGLLEGEEGEAIASGTMGDRLQYDIPQHQIDYLKRIKNNFHKPVIVVIAGGSPMNLSVIHELADALLLCWYPGEQGGNAIADVIFGKSNPSGRLPVTFPMSLDQLPPFEDYSMQGRTYKFMKTEPMYPFGFGLSFSKFSYSDIRVSKNAFSNGDSVYVSCKLSNVGKVAGTETVQLYIQHLYDGAPNYILKGIQKQNLRPGESRIVYFKLPYIELSTFEEDGSQVIKPGQANLIIGGSLPIPRAEKLGSSQPQIISITKL